MYVTNARNRAPQVTTSTLHQPLWRVCVTKPWGVCRTMNSIHWRIFDITLQIVVHKYSNVHNLAAVT